MDGIGRLGHDPPLGPSADWWVLATADAAGTNGLTCLPKDGGTRDRRFLVTHPMIELLPAYERRFPSCPQIPVVLDCLITEDSWSDDDSQRDTTRRCQLNVEAPYLLKKMIGVDYVYFIQKNHLDLESRVLEIEATNETFAARVGVVEKCRYYEEEDHRKIILPFETDQLCRGARWLRGGSWPNLPIPSMGKACALAVGTLIG
ncbi:hypothetical protein evm_009607 [Chilo suppressalis]|nr:hypothetical protein evm_009607 [Chilo suppressalis]